MSILEAIGLSAMVAMTAAGGAGFVLWRLRRRAADTPKVTTDLIAEHVRAVGRLVGLEVRAKEIATARQGADWLPPILLSPARVAMVFHFERQYSVDLSRIRVESADASNRRFRVVMPPVEHDFRLADFSPYDIQDGRVLGLFDVIPMTADRQAQLTVLARERAQEVFKATDTKYAESARRVIEAQLRALLGVFGLEVEISWPDARVTPSSPIDAEPVAALPDPIAAAAGSAPARAPDRVRRPAACCA